MEALGPQTESLQELLETLPLLQVELEERPKTSSDSPEIREEEVLPISEKTFSMEEICQLTEVRPYLLRFWESEFIDIDPITQEDGQKVYSEKNLETIKKIKHLLLEEKLTIERARHLLTKTANQMVVNIDEFSEETSQNQGEGDFENLVEENQEVTQTQCSDPEERNKSEDAVPIVLEPDEDLKDRIIAKTTFVTRFQKNEVGPGVEGVQRAQDMALKRVQAQILNEGLSSKREELYNIKEKLEALILEMKLKKNELKLKMGMEL